MFALVRDVKQLDLTCGLRALNEYRGRHGYGIQLGRDLEVA